MPDSCINLFLTAAFVDFNCQCYGVVGRTVTTMDHSPLIKAAVAIVLPVHQCEIFGATVTKLPDAKPLKLVSYFSPLAKK